MVCAAPRKCPPWPTSSCAPNARDASSISSGVNSTRSILQQLDVDDELLVAADQAALQPAGRVHDEVGAGQERRQQRHQRLVRGLRVGRLRRVQPAAGAERQPVVPGQLAGAQQADGRLRGAERRRAGLHVDVGQERAEDHRAARPDQLGQRDAGQRLGQLLGQRGRDRHRGHRAHQQERGQHHRLGGPVVLELRVQHPVVPAQRRVAVDQRDRGRRPLDRALPLPRGRRTGSRSSRSCRRRSARRPRCPCRSCRSASAARRSCPGAGSRAARRSARRSRRRPNPARRRPGTGWPAGGSPAGWRPGARRPRARTGSRRPR